MSIEKEIEFKNELTQNEFYNLMNYFQKTKSDFFTQLNIYFDTYDLQIRKKHAMLRVRIKNDTYELTLKEPDKIGLTEINQRINESQFKEILKNSELPMGIVREHVEKFVHSPQITEIARLETKRLSFPFNDTELFLDISSYYGQVDYELELEVKDYHAGLKVFNKLLKSFDIPLRPAKSKIERAFNSRLNI